MSIKLNRCRKLSTTGRYPATHDAMLSHVPADIIDRLPAAALAMLVDHIYTCVQRDKAIALTDAINEGGIWDHEKGCFRSLVNTTTPSRLKKGVESKAA